MAREDDAKVRVRLDTKLAKATLSKLVKEGKKTAKGLRQEIKRGVGSGLGVIGMGGGIGLGLAAVRSASQSSFGDIVGETFGHLGSQLAHWAFGDLAEQARAKRAAREETIQAFGMIAGRKGEITPTMRNYFEQVSQINKDMEAGRRIFESDKDMRGPGLDDLIKRIGGAILTALKEFGSWLLQQIGLR